MNQKQKQRSERPRIVRICPPKPGVKGEICVGGVCFQWPDPAIGFKPQVEGWKDVRWPCIVLGGNWGRQLVYDDETQNTYFEDEAPVFWVYPETGQYKYAGGEEIVEGLEDRRALAVAKKYNQMYSQGIVEGPPVEVQASRFHLNDLYLNEEEDAFTRSVYLTNLPQQTDDITVAKVYQANSKETFNDYLEQLKEDGWKGLWVRPNDSVWGDVEYFVSEPL